MAKKKITDFLPDKSGEVLVLVQAKIDEDLHIKVRALMSDDNITWNELIEASLRCYLEEKKAS